MKYLLLTFDIEEFDLPEEYGIRINEEEKFKVGFDGTKRILSLLGRTNIKSTFFVTAKFAERYPKLIKKISQNHEIALHGYDHSDNYGKMDEKDSEIRLRKAKKIIEKIIRNKVYGFRAPRMDIKNYSILSDLKIKYDSSLHPTYIHRRYNNLFKTRRPHFIKNILEIPISVTPFLRLPFTFVWFRNFGLNYAKICTKLNFINSDCVNIYFHPYDFLNIKKLKYSSKIPNLLTRNTGKILERNLEKYIGWCKRSKLKSITMSEYMENHKKYNDPN